MREEEAMIAVIAIICGTCLLYAVCNRVSSILRTWIQTALKREMVARGYPANEIIAVVQAERNANRQVELGNVPPAKPIRQPAY